MNEGDTFSFERAVAFADTDMSGRVHFSMILRYVEEAEHAWFAACGQSIISESHGWPRAHIDCDYRAPLTFGDIVLVNLEVTRVGKRSMSYAFRICKEQHICAEGNMVIVRVDTTDAM
jgi:acyl-CoA thioester hydrolase